MRNPSNDPAARPRRSKPQPVKNAATPSRKKKQQPLDDDAAPDDAGGLAMREGETNDARSADSVETLPELEREIGMADWLDPQTGEPAEGQSPPHIQDD
jgi:hypothetical protein